MPARNPAALATLSLAVFEALSTVRDEMYWREQGHTDSDSLGTLAVNLRHVANKVDALRTYKLKEEGATSHAKA